MSYSEEEFLQLSGLQHFKFCRRQWALIHIEQQWAENSRTVDGALMHENAHDADFRESRGDLLVTRGVSVFSSTLEVSGQCDVLEYHRGIAGIPIRGNRGADGNLRRKGHRSGLLHIQRPVSRPGLRGKQR